MPSSNLPRNRRPRRSIRTSASYGARTWILRSPAATLRFGARLARELQGGDVVALFGELGVGKTQLVRGLAKGLQASQAEVGSPTFVFIHEYHGYLPLAHVDLYRVDSPQDLDHLGWADYLDGRWVVAVEWAQKAGAQLPHNRVDCHLAHRTPTTRVITCVPFGATARALVARLPNDPSPRRKKGHIAPPRRTTRRRNH